MWYLEIKPDKVNLLLNEEVDLLPVEEAVVDLAFPHPVQPVQHHARVEALFGNMCVVNLSLSLSLFLLFTLFIIFF